APVHSLGAPARSPWVPSPWWTTSAGVGETADLCKRISRLSEQGGHPMTAGTTTMWRSRWAAVGAAVAVTLGAGGISLVDAAKGTGERAVYTAIEPCRLLDTRPNHGVGGRAAPLGPAEVYPVT